MPKIEIYKRNGYVHGYQHPTIEIVIQAEFLKDFESEKLKNLTSFLCSELNFHDNLLCLNEQLKQPEDILLFFNCVATHLQSLAKLRAVESSCYNKKKDFANLVVTIPVHQRVLDQVFIFIRQLVGYFSSNSLIPPSVDFKNALVRIKTQLEFIGLRSSNIPHFIESAYDLGIPTYFLPGDVIQYGQGKNARWLNSTFTDATSQLSAQFARNKKMASTLMGYQGIPVAQHYLVGNVSQALKASKLLGYPIVIKPADMDGGVGVTVKIVNDDEILDAFLLASKFSKSILVEKYFEGKDYRLVVLHDEVIWAIERVPGGVVGDGVNTIRDLVEMQNHAISKNSANDVRLYPIIWDKEAEKCLKRSGKNELTIPAIGEFVQLRLAANIALGGQPVSVFDKVHPDNINLAVRAAQAVQLDLAGIDLLIPDISKSWFDSGAVICEVNAQPNIGYRTTKHLYPEILTKLLKKNGRIPIVFVLKKNGSQSLFVNQLVESIKNQITVGTFIDGYVSIGDLKIQPNKSTLFNGVRSLIFNKSVDLIIAEFDYSMLTAEGLPVSRYDLLVYIDSTVNSNKPFATQSQNELDSSELLDELMLACDGQVHILTDVKDLSPKNIISRFDNLDDMVCVSKNYIINQLGS